MTQYNIVYRSGAGAGAPVPSYYMCDNLSEIPSPVDGDQAFVRPYYLYRRANGAWILPVDTSYNLPSPPLILSNQSNTFTVSPQIVSAGTPVFQLYETGAPANARVWRILASGQLLYIQCTDDAVTTSQSVPLLLNRSGDALIARDIYEKGRGTPVGHWINVPYSAGLFSAAGGGTWTVEAGDYIYFSYSVVGKTMLVKFAVGATTIAGTVTALLVTMPGGYSTTDSTPQPMYTNAGNSPGIIAGWGNCIAEGNGSTFRIILDMNASVAWPVQTNTLYVFGGCTLQLA